MADRPAGSLAANTPTVSLSVPENERDKVMLPRSETVARYQQPPTQNDVVLDCGWGRLLFSQTFADGETLLDELLRERQGRRDIAFYVDDPHVLLSRRPQQVFLDPSHTYRLDLDGDLTEEQEAPFLIRPLESAEDAMAVNRCYAQRGMVEVGVDFFLSRRGDEQYLHLVACDQSSGKILGTITGLDHVSVFGDPERGSSLWC